MKRSSTVILANGSFPRRGSEGWRTLLGAEHIVACDGAADSCLRRTGRIADVAVGDLDSIKSAASAKKTVKVSDQDSNDLKKAIDYCASKGWRDPVVLGACGKRDDHAIGNVFLALDHGLEAISDYGRFLPVKGKRTLRLPVGTAVSVFTSDPSARMRSRGLRWPLDGVKFDRLYKATLNRTSEETVTVWSDSPACIYVASCGKRKGGGA